MVDTPRFVRSRRTISPIAARPGWQISPERRHAGKFAMNEQSTRGNPPSANSRHAEIRDPRSANGRHAEILHLRTDDTRRFAIREQSARMRGHDRCVPQAGAITHLAEMTTRAGICCRRTTGVAVGQAIAGFRGWRSSRSANGRHAGGFCVRRTVDTPKDSAAGEQSIRRRILRWVNSRHAREFLLNLAEFLL